MLKGGYVWCEKGLENGLNDGSVLGWILMNMILIVWKSVGEERWKYEWNGEGLRSIMLKVCGR